MNILYVIIAIVIVVAIVKKLAKLALFLLAVGVLIYLVKGTGVEGVSIIIEGISSIASKI